MSRPDGAPDRRDAIRRSNERMRMANSPHQLPPGAAPTARSARLSDDEVAAHRHTDCAVYDACLDSIAVRDQRVWMSWSCAACPLWERP